MLIADVTADSPAAKAGIQRGDVVTAIDGVRMEDSQHLRNSVALGGAGRRVRIDVLRDGKAKSFDVTLEEARGDARELLARSEEQGVFEGITVQELAPKTRARFEIPGVHC